MISYSTYRTLRQDLQAALLWRYGVYMEIFRETAQASIELYSLFDFYVEIYFDKQTDDPFLLRSFSSSNGLEPYLSFIEIDTLFETK